jgi:hypothetical protein
MGSKQLVVAAKLHAIRELSGMGLPEWDAYECNEVR